MNKIWKICFSILHFVMKKIVKKPMIEGEKNISGKTPPFIFVSNHELSWGPVITYLFLPWEVHPWVISYLIERGKCRKYIKEDFVIKELKLHGTPGNLVSSLIEIFTIPMMKYINAIPVYPINKKLLLTFRKSLDLLKKGKNLIIFPEDNNSANEIIKKFKSGFIKLAKIYYEETKRRIYFVPLAISKKYNFIKILKPVKYNPNNKFSYEKKRILNYLRNSIINCLSLSGIQI